MIRLLGVTVERVHFADTPTSARGRDLSVLWQIERRLSSDLAKASCALTISVYSKPGDAAFLLDATLVGSFERDDEGEALTLEEFMRVNGPAQVVPFVREFVSNLTARSRAGVVMLPSVNLVALVQELDRQAAEATASERTDSGGSVD